MPDLWHFNSILLNGGKKGAWAVGQDDIIFNGFGLQNQNFVTSDVNFWNMPKINLLTYDNPKNDGWGVLDRFYKQRTITLSGSILGEDSTDIENKIDSLKKALSIKTWYLDFKVNGVYRRILCSLTNSDIISRAHYDVDKGKFKLTFTAMDPFWSEKTWASKTFTSVNAEINEDIYNAGSQYSNPVINILVNSASSVTQIKVKIGDNEIVINNAITTWDIVEINTISKEVTINGSSIDFGGKFPKLEAGVNNLNVKSNGTYNFDIAVLFSKNYL